MTTKARFEARMEAARKALKSFEAAGVPVTSPALAARIGIATKTAADYLHRLGYECDNRAIGVWRKA